MAKYQVLVTDYAWPSLEIERRILGAVGAELRLQKAARRRSYYNWHLRPMPF